MTEKNIFAHKLFLPLNIADFDLFLCENCNPLFPSKPPLKVEVLSSPPGLIENLVGGSTPPQQKKVGAHYDCLTTLIAFS